MSSIFQIASRPRSITSPMKFLIGSGLINELPAYVKDFGKSALIISDDFIEPRISRIASESFSGDLRYHLEKFNKECTDTEISRFTTLVQQLGADVVVGIGGGKTMDTAKAVAHYNNKPVVIIPTIASTDAPCTALSVVYKDNGEFDRYLFLPQNPDVVVADTEVLAQAPARFFAAGVGDALATFFEARACYASGGTNLVLARPSRTGLGIAELCYKLIGENIESGMASVRAKTPSPALEQLIEATIYLSGVGAESGGLACAHAVNNGMSIVPYLHHLQHGEKVVFGLLTQLVLENAPAEEWREVVRICKIAGLPLSMEEFGVQQWIEADWRKVAESACAPGDSMGNMPKKVTPEEVYQAMRSAFAVVEVYKKQVVV